MIDLNKQPSNPIKRCLLLAAVSAYIVAWCIFQTPNWFISGTVYVAGATVIGALIRAAMLTDEL